MRQLDPDFKVYELTYVRMKGDNEEVAKIKVAVDTVQEFSITEYDDSPTPKSITAWTVNIPVETFKKHLVKDMGFMEQ